MSEHKAKKSQMMEYILKTIGLSDKNLTYVVEDLSIKRDNIIEGMNKDNLIKMKY